MNQGKIVIVSTVYPFPSDTGKKVVLAGIVSYLCDTFGAKNIIYVLIGKGDQHTRDLAAFSGTLVHAPKPGMLAQLVNIVRFVLIGRKKSIQESLLYSRHICKQLDSIISTHAPDTVIFDTVRTGQFLEKLDLGALKQAHTILYMEDLFSVRYHKMIDTIIKYPDMNMDPLGNFRVFLPSMLASAARFRSMQIKLLKLEERLIAKSEVRYPKLFNTSLLLNDKEADDLKNIANIANIRSIKPLLPQAGSEARARNYRGGSDFIFLGSLNYPQNQLAIEHFIAQYMDRVIQLIPNIRLRIIGRGARPELRALVERYTGHISLDGYVDDIEAIMSESCAMIVPLLFGSGIKLKTLEAFSSGLPVICTDYGVEGIPVKNGIHCIVENDLDRFPLLMASLRSIEYNYMISKACRNLYTAYYSRSAVTKEYEEIFE